jgi:DNA modification methylase
MKELMDIQFILEAANDKTIVKGYTHDFYNYPARFSPNFVREVIKKFSKPDDLIIDPFVGGGTSLIEARLLNRNSIGFDISSLAIFIAKTKTSSLTPTEISVIKKRSFEIVSNLNCHSTIERPTTWIERGYQRNISNNQTWPIRKMIEQIINEIEGSNFSIKINNFLRCGVLKAGQWGLDNKKDVPSADKFRIKLMEIILEMCDGATEFYNALTDSDKKIKTFCINRPSSEIHKVQVIKKMKPPSLILTSPPYPGVHVVYHRWQIHGKKETPAPFWIANSLDGHGLTHYAMGGRKQKGLENYFANILKTFSSIKKVCSNETLIVQMLAFSDASWQLPKYLDIMNLAGFDEVHFTTDRIWRDVPNRKWYADTKGKIGSSNEVVLFHKLTS